MSKEFIGAIIIIIVSILKAFNIAIESDVVAGLVTGLAGLWVAYHRYKRGDITKLGFRKLPQ